MPASAAQSIATFFPAGYNKQKIHEVAYMMNDTLILVDACDRAIGTAGKSEAHRAPLLHRAFSVFLYDDSGQEPALILQQRALTKYHSGGLWCNTCCSHPRPGETILAAAERRLEEELGITGCRGLRELTSFVYLHKFHEQLYEYEYDHVLLGTYRGPVQPNPEEAMAIQKVSASALAEELRLSPASYASWFLTAAPMVLRALS